MTSLLDAAISYAKAGFQVFPCKGKTPVTPNGHKDATTSLSVVRGWFTNPEPKTTLAIAIPSWAIVLDIDGALGMRSLNNNGFNPPATATVRTKRGYHYWYEWSGPAAPTRKVGFLPGVDLLCNGYAIVPPSDGYVWYDSDLTDRENIEVAPEWMNITVTESNSYRDKVEPEEWFSGIPEGQRQTGLFRYACRLRGQPGRTRVEAKILLAHLAKVSEGQGYKKYPDTDALVDRVWKTYEGVEEEEAEPEIYSLSELDAIGLEPPEYLIKDMIPMLGYTVLSSRPKAGKSIAAAQAAASVACGLDIWGKRTVQSGVLYIDAEQDGPSALDRWRKIMRGIGVDSMPSNLSVAFSWRPMDHGGLDDIGKFLAGKPTVRMVVIDTLADVYPDEETKGSGSAYNREQRIMRHFHKLSKDYGVAVVLITHDNKGDAKSLMHRASGTFAVTGKAQSVWGLERNKTTDKAVLSISGKNIPDQEIKLALDREHLIWRVDYH